MRTSPPTLTGDSPRAMIPPANPFAGPQSAARSASLAAPSVSRAVPRSPGYSLQSYNHSTSLSTASGGLSDIQNHDAPGLIVSPTQISSATLNAQKRAYRQRRKDPSCDACRERKVKCDATETSACSECSSRNHKCQFTKETNRRMSSIKQVQDLQSQIAELTQANTHLRTQMSDREERILERPDTKRRLSDFHFSPPPPLHRVAVHPITNFDHVRENIQTYSRGIFHIPHASHPAPMNNDSASPELPIRADFARLARSYQRSIHEWFPILHWPTFQEEIDQVYTERSFNGVSREWIGLFFAVLACGSMQVPQAQINSEDGSQHGLAYYDIAVHALIPWSSTINIAHAQTALLLSIFAQESSLGPVGEIWLNSAISIAQELHLHRDSNFGSIVDLEVSRRLWWSLYVRDRVTSIETGRPMLIHEDDCEAPLPITVEDRYIQPQGVFRSHSNSPPFTGFLAIMQIAQLHRQVYRVLKSSIVTPQVLSELIEQFQTKTMQLPEAYGVGSNSALEIAALPPLFALLSLQYHLYRRNLSPTCRPSERSDALDRCFVVAQDTAKHISRALHNPTKQELDKSWPDRVGQITSSWVCKHLWRCILILCYRNDFDAALMCQHFCAAIGSSRKVNIACAKNLRFFLGVLLEREHGVRGSPQQAEPDEEMLAYVSGDAQGNPGQSWVWAGIDMASPKSANRTSFPARHSVSSDEPMRDARTVRSQGGSPERGFKEGEHWTKVEQMIRQLLEQSRLPTTSYYPPPHNPMKRVQLTADPQSTPRTAPTPSRALSSTSRISIANII